MNECMNYICCSVWLLPINPSPRWNLLESFLHFGIWVLFIRTKQVDLPSLLWSSIFDIQYCPYFVSTWESVGYPLCGFSVKCIFQINKVQQNRVLFLDSVYFIKFVFPTFIIMAVIQLKDVSHEQKGGCS